MVVQPAFAVEQYMDKYEENIKYNLGETCVESLTMGEILDEESRAKIVSKLLDTQLTYGHIRGSPELKTAIAALYDDLEITGENIVVTNGAIGGNFLAFYSIVNAGDHVIVVDPSYQQLSSVPGVFGAKVEPFEIKLEDNYLPDLDLLRSMVAQNHTKLLVINNPNNPTGYVWENETLLAIVEICREHNVTLLCDEVYRPLFHQSQAKSIVSFGYDNTISSGSMSKAFSLAGLRLGWLVSRNTDLIDGFWEKRDYNTISVLVVDDIMATAALQNREKILVRNHELCKKNLDRIEEFIAQSSGAFLWLRPQGGSTCFVRLNKNVSTMAMAVELAEKHGVLVVPGEVFGKPGWLRIGFGNNAEGLSKGLDVMQRWVDEN